MSVDVMTWVWKHSKSKGNDRLVLLAISDNAHEDGGGAFLKTATLVRKTGLSERTIQAATKRLGVLGELKTYPNAGPGGVNRYRVIMTGATPAESAPPQNLHPADIAGDPAESAPLPPQILRGDPADSAPITVIEPSVEPPEIKTSSASSAKPPTNRGTRIPDDFAVTAEMVAWAADRCPQVDGRHETEKFVLYWQARPGAGGRKLDWVKTWKTWMLTAAERLGPARTVRSTGADIIPFTGRDQTRRSTTDDRVNQAREAGRAVQARMNQEDRR